MMQESKLTNFQQRKLRETMMSKTCHILLPVLLLSHTLHLSTHLSCLPDGQPLPAQCLPTSSKPGSGRPARSSQTVRKKKSGTRSGLRSKESIQQMSDCSPNYRPPPQSNLMFLCYHSLVHIRYTNVVVCQRTHAYFLPMRAT